MAFASGNRLGGYEVVGLLGAGGMGEVYRARDAQLNWDVALKILTARFALDLERLAQFRREAQVLASLNRPKDRIAQDRGGAGRRLRAREQGSTTATSRQAGNAPDIGRIPSNSGKLCSGCGVPGVGVKETS